LSNTVYKPEVRFTKRDNLQGVIEQLAQVGCRISALEQNVFSTHFSCSNACFAVQFVNIHRYMSGFSIIC